MVKKMNTKESIIWLRDAEKAVELKHHRIDDIVNKLEQGEKAESALCENVILRQEIEELKKYKKVLEELERMWGWMRLTETIRNITVKNVINNIKQNHSIKEI